MRSRTFANQPFQPCPALRRGFIFRSEQTVFFPLALLQKPQASNFAKTHPSEVDCQPSAAGRERSLFMKSNYFFAALLSLLMGFVLVVQGQTRPRRVGSDGGTPQTGPVTNSPTPVLRGTKNSEAQAPSAT